VIDSSSPSPRTEPQPTEAATALPRAWLSLCIGNTRAHWTYLDGDRPRATWDLPHITAGDTRASLANYLEPYLMPCRPPTESRAGAIAEERSTSAATIPIAIASVVPERTALWRTWLDRERRPHRILQLADIPLAGLYPTLGIDRALAGLGVGCRLGFPCLTIDGGTALTFTGFAAADGTGHSGPEEAAYERDDRGHLRPRGELVGGAIVPGMGLQYRSLGQYAAQLPDIHTHVQPVRDRLEIAARVTALAVDLAPERWARDTASAIDSGIQRAIGALAWDFIEDWWRRYPGATVAIAGGDALAIRAAIARHLDERRNRDLTADERERLRVVPEAIVWGTIATLRSHPAWSEAPDCEVDRA